MDGEDHQILLVAPLHGGPSRALLRHPVQGPLGFHPGSSPLPHYLKLFGGLSYLSLGYAGRGRGGRTRSVRTGGPMTCGIFYADDSLLL